MTRLNPMENHCSHDVDSDGTLVSYFGVSFRASSCKQKHGEYNRNKWT